MYWFLATLAVVVGILVVIAIRNHSKRVEQKRREAEKKAEQMRQYAERRAKQRAKEERKIAQIKRFYLKLNELPFQLDEKQIIYVENEYDEAVNKFILRNYDKICENFRYRGYEFCYLPKLVGEISEELLAYHSPGDKNSKTASVQSSFLLDFMAHPENRINIKPSLIYFVNGLEVQEGEDLALRGVTLGDLNWRDCRLKSHLSAIQADLFRDRKNPIRYRTVKTNDTSTTIERYRSPNEEPFPRVQFSIEPNDPIERIEERFDVATSLLISEVAEKISKLKQRGVSLYVLEQMLQEPAKPSRMVITSDYRILLPDYQNMEIEMTPLVKAVYMLFLRHPEGIIFKHLPDYQAEVMDIYKKIKGESLDEKMIRSVMDVTSPIKNSINEKCARIREAFVSRFDERLAITYIVRGERGAPKLISLPRELVEWQ